VLKSAILVSACGVVLAYLFYAEGAISWDRSLARTKVGNLISTLIDAVGNDISTPDTTPDTTPATAVGPLSPFQIVTPDIPLLANMTVARQIAKKIFGGGEVGRSGGKSSKKHWGPAAEKL